MMKNSNIRKHFQSFDMVINKQLFENNTGVYEYIIKKFDFESKDNDFKKHEKIIIFTDDNVKRLAMEIIEVINLIDCYIIEDTWKNKNQFVIEVKNVVQKDRSLKITIVGCELFTESFRGEKCELAIFDINKLETEIPSKFIPYVVNFMLVCEDMYKPCHGKILVYGNKQLLCK